MNAATALIFFASGAAALIFETLWFRQTGHVVGNSVWASSLVTASFMAGLAVGNAVALRVGFRVPRPMRVFAALELIVAVTGTGLVFLLPRLGPVLGPLWAALPESTVHVVRLLGSFLLLAVPATAMGMTLPLLSRSLGARDPNFGRVLGRLYGWNTLGAVAGTWCTEAWLVPRFGIQGSGLLAAGLDVAAASAAWWLDRRLADLPPAVRPAKGLRSGTARIGLAAFGAGALLLALEIVWFRFLALFVVVTSATFATMLGVVLAGIAAGALLGSWWMGRRPSDSGLAAAVALLSGITVVVTYGLFDARAMPVPGLAFPAAALMLPTCLCSGLLFTLLGRQLHLAAPEETRAAGLLTVCNTLGAMTGSLLAGFVLLPRLGMERSLFLLALAYGGVALLAVAGTGPRERKAAGFAAGLLAAAVLLFPFGRMARRHVQVVESEFSRRGTWRVAAMREGLTETVFLLRQDLAGEPLHWRLLTNGVSMATTEFGARRYMGAYVWWPVALHRDPRRALVISYGVGNTARALAATPSLSAIDVVDVSADVLAMSRTIWPRPGENPLLDPAG